MGLPVFARCDEELEVLRVAGADLQDVRVLGDVLDVLLAEQLGDDLQARSPSSRIASRAQPFLAEALEFVGRSARLVGAAAQDGRAGGFHGVARWS